MNLELTLDPKAIIVRRDTRQRQSNIADCEDIKASLRSTGFLINPIVVRQDADGQPLLVAEKPRLRAHLELELPSISVRWLESMSEIDAEIIELEENVKRKELEWKDNVKAVGRIHALMAKRTQGWKIEQTSQSLSLTIQHMRKILHVYDAIDSPRIAHVETLEQAYNTLSKFAERRAENIVSGLIANGAELFSPMPKPKTEERTETFDEFNITSAVKMFDETPVTELLGETVNLLEARPISISISVEPPAGPIICANFLEWAKTYSGPKFTLIHCDFPYGNYRGEDSQGAMSGVETETFYDNHESIYWDLLTGLTSNLDRIMSYSAHLVFWFNMNFYTETVHQLRATGLMVHDHPFIWHKTPGGGGGLGVVPGTAVTYPRRTYDTALLAVRGNRPLAKPGMNSYAAPTVGNKIHPSQKPEPMLRHFLSMVVDETTTVLDPTCGSAAALRAAEDLGAKSILGLELDQNYASSALSRTLQARVMRKAGALARTE